MKRHTTWRLSARGDSALSSDAWRYCYTCRDYLSTRRERLAIELGKRAKQTGRDVIELADEFMDAAHQRHLDGQPLREGGPTRVTDPVSGRLAALAMLGRMFEEPEED